MAQVQHKIENALMRAVYPLFVKLRRPRPAGQTKLDLSKFELVFEEDFSDPALPRWDVRRYPDGRRVTMRKGGYWSRDMATVEDGQLHIRAAFRPDGPYGPGYYAACLDTRYTYQQTYGYFECRCKLPAAEGLWSSFWLQSDAVKAGVPPTAGMEIDVFESPLYRQKDNGIVTTNLHYNGYGPGHRFQNVGFFRVDEPYTQFHTYGVEWNAREYIFYIDGFETARSSFGGVSQGPEYMMLSVEVDGVGGYPDNGWSGNIRQNAPGALPADFVVDYVRAYQYKDKGRRA